MEVKRFLLTMKEMEKDTRDIQREQSREKLIEELNELSSDSEKNKERMVEIAKILLAEHYWFKRKDNN